MHAWLDTPLFYRLTQRVLAPGAKDYILNKLYPLLPTAAHAGRLLDVGCGPVSTLRRMVAGAVALDLNPSYALPSVTRGPNIVATACRLPFADNAFDLVWSGGLLHHLNEGDVRAALAEMQRVTRRGGRVVVFDAVLPTSAWQSPMAYAIRKVGRGNHMRSEAALRELLPDSRWKCERIVYSRTGLEGVFAMTHKE